MSYLTYQNQTIESWKIVFIITGSLLISSGIIYVIFADSSQQAWSNGKIKKNQKRVNENGEEMDVLNKTFTCNEENFLK